jgi:choline dehydrogenase-like flavoprotein
VVDSSGKVHGVEGLYVVDASAIPTTIGVNPQHTIAGANLSISKKIS